MRILVSLFAVMLATMFSSFAAAEVDDSISTDPACTLLTGQYLNAIKAIDGINFVIKNNAPDSLEVTADLPSGRKYIAFVATTQEIKVRVNTDLPNDKWVLVTEPMVCIGADLVPRLFIELNSR